MSKAPEVKPLVLLIIHKKFKSAAAKAQKKFKEHFNIIVRFKDNDINKFKVDSPEPDETQTLIIAQFVRTEILRATNANKPSGQPTKIQWTGDNYEAVKKFANRPIEIKKSGSLCAIIPGGTVIVNKGEYLAKSVKGRLSKTKE